MNAPYGVVLKSSLLILIPPIPSWKAVRPVLAFESGSTICRLRSCLTEMTCLSSTRPNTALNVFRSMSKKEAVKSVVTIASSREFPHEISLVMKAKGFPPSAVERTDLVDKSITGKKALKRELLYYLEFV